MMFKRFLFLFIALLLLVNIQVISQTTFDLNASYDRGYEDNLYHSPTTYVDANDDFFPSADMIVDDMFSDFRGRLRTQHKFNKKNRLNLEYKTWLRRYDEYKNANQSSHMVKSSFRHVFSKKVNGSLYARYQRENRIGTNVLGDELVLDFAFNQYYFRSYVNIKTSKKNRVNGEVSYRYRDFDPVEERRSFSYGEFRLQVQNFYSYTIGSMNNRLKASVEWKDRPYNERLSRTSEGKFLPENSLRHDRYLEVAVVNRLTVLKNLTIEPQFAFKRRIDRFGNYFSFHQWSEALKVSYKRKKWNASASGEFNQRKYLVRLAPNGSPDDSRLRYNFIRFRFEAGYLLTRGLTLIARYRHVDRDTNVNAETIRTRRPYNFTEITGGVYFNLNKFRKNFSK